jgi:tetratricopeptide (TPR) repeat protein
MFERLRSRLRSSELAPRLREWTADRSEHQTEGERLFEEADYAGAELALAQAVLDGERRQHTPDKRILVRLELAEAQRKQVRPDGDPRKLAMAEQTIRSALELANKSAEYGLAVQCIDALAGIVADQGNLTEVEALAQEAAAMEGKAKRRDPMVAARRLRRLGRLRHSQGKSREAAEALAECVTLHEQALGTDHLETAHGMSELAALYHALGNHTETQRYLRSALKVHEQHGGLDGAEAVADRQLLTASFEASGDLDGAAALLERFLALKLRVVGVSIDEIADLQASLGHRYIGWRRHSRARELLMEAVGTFKRTGGPRLAYGYESLAQLEEEAGHYHDAIRELSRAAKVWESIQTEHVQELIENLEHRAFLFSQLRQDREAGYLRDQAAVLTQTVRTAAG